MAHSSLPKDRPLPTTTTVNPRAPPLLRRGGRGVRRATPAGAPGLVQPPPPPLLTPGFWLPASTHAGFSPPLPGRRSGTACGDFRRVLPLRQATVPFPYL